MEQGSVKVKNVCQLASKLNACSLENSDNHNNLNTGINCIFRVLGWDCDTCKADVMAVNNAYGSMEGINAIVNNLSGYSFCLNPDMAFTEDEQKVCANVIEQFMPPALQALTAAATEESIVEVCTNLYDGIC